MIQLELFIEGDENCCRISFSDEITMILGLEELFALLDPYVRKLILKKLIVHSPLFARPAAKIVKISFVGIDAV